MTHPTTYVALLRAINLGRRNKVPMKELSALFERLGGREVRTYLQSGNVVFAASPALAREIPSRVTAAIAERYEFEAPTVVRSAAELGEIVERNPYAELDEDPRFIQVGFLGGEPTADAVAALDPERSPQDAFAVSERELFVHYPKGTARSKLTNKYFERVLGVTCTMRNWRTVTALAEMVS